MSEARPVSDGDRLPWLEPYREAPNRRATPPKPPSRSFSPLMIVGLVIAGALALGGYWVGRRVAPDVGRSVVVASLPPAVESGPKLAYRSLDDRLTEPAPPPPPPPPPPPAAKPETRPSRAATSARRVVRALPQTEAPAPIRRRQRAAPVPPPPRRVAVRTTSVPVGKPGETVLLGTFASPALADAARARLVGRYPYLGTLPKAIAPVPWGHRTAYQLKMGPGSRRNARTLCKYMLSIGRGCAVV